MWKAARIILLTIIIGMIYWLAQCIGWAAILFWKSGVIAISMGVVTTIITWPLFLIPVRPQSFLDTPVFIVPMMILCFLGWAFLIELIWSRTRKRAVQKP